MILASGARQLVVQDALEIYIGGLESKSELIKVFEVKETYNFVLWVIIVEVNTAYIHWGIC